MDTFKISITTSKPYIYNKETDEYELDTNAPSDYFVYTNRGREYLFRFHQSSVDSKVRYFVIPGSEDRSIHIVSDEFPVDYLLKFAQAVITIRYGIIDFGVRLTAEAKKTLGVK